MGNHQRRCIGCCSREPGAMLTDSDRFCTRRRPSPSPASPFHLDCGPDCSTSAARVSWLLVDLWPRLQDWFSQLARPSPSHCLCACSRPDLAGGASGSFQAFSKTELGGAEV